MAHPLPPQIGDVGVYFWENYTPETGPIRICVLAEVVSTKADGLGNNFVDLAFVPAARPEPYTGEPYPFANPLLGVPLSPQNANPGPYGTFWDAELD